MLVVGEPIVYGGGCGGLKIGERLRHAHVNGDCLIEQREE